MTITEQIRLKLKTVDEELRTGEAIADSMINGIRGEISGLRLMENHYKRARRILREICELDGESDGKV